MVLDIDTLFYIILHLYNWVLANYTPSCHTKSQYTDPRSQSFWSKSAEFSYPLPVNEKQNRNGQESKSEKAKKTGGPWHAQIVVHLYGEKGEPSSRHRSENTVGCDRTIRVHQIDINDVAQAPVIQCQCEEAGRSVIQRNVLQENHKNSSTNRYTSNDLRHPCDVWITCPCKPEESYGQ